MGEEFTDQTRQQIFKTTYRRKIDLRRMTAVCKGDRELARSLVVNALREIAGNFAAYYSLQPRLYIFSQYMNQVMNNGL